MVYVYKCPNCSKEFDIIKSIAEIDRLEYCDCGKQLTRTISFRGIFQGERDWDKAEYNPGLGCVTRSAKHRKQICKERDLEELGNMDINKYSKDSEKRLDDKIKAIYDRNDN